MIEVTIAIPFYNAERFLASTIDSVLAQSYQDFILLLIDDGSTDTSLQIAQQFAQKDSRIKVYSDGENKNLGFRLNQIPSLVQTPYLVRMDADDLMHPKKIEKQIKVLKNHPEIDVLGTNIYSIDENNRVVGIRDSMRANEMETVHSFWHPTIMAKTDWFRQNPYDVKAERIEDIELWMSSKGKANFKQLTEPLLFYREFGSQYWKKYFKGNSSVVYVLKKHRFSLDFILFAFRYYIAGLVYFCFDLFRQEQVLIQRRNAIKLPPKPYQHYIHDTK
jgi:glycosyltransferase involved in cell wall biosynthesis